MSNLGCNSNEQFHPLGLIAQLNAAEPERDLVLDPQRYKAVSKILDKSRYNTNNHGLGYHYYCGIGWLLKWQFRTRAIPQEDQPTKWWIHVPRKIASLRPQYFIEISIGQKHGLYKCRFYGNEAPLPFKVYYGTKLLFATRDFQVVINEFLQRDVRYGPKA